MMRLKRGNLHQFQLQFLSKKIALKSSSRQQKKERKVEVKLDWTSAKPTKLFLTKTALIVRLYFQIKRQKGRGQWTKALQNLPSG